MKERRERWFNLPFSLGCASQSSTAVGTPSHPVNATLTSKQGSQVCSSIVKRRKYSIGFSLPKPNISLGIRRLIKSLRSVSQIFAYKDEMEEEEAEMEIGHPTDVKHLTHIGWDGSTTITNHNAKGSWDSLTPPELISFPSISLKQFELAMAAQAQAQGHSHPQLLVHSSKS